MTRVPLSELPEFVRNVLCTLRLDWNHDGAVILALQGELGAGKTTFVQQLAKQFDIADTVVSPTYVIMKSYDLPETRTWFGEKRRFKKMVHIDAYRLESPEQFNQLKPETFLADPSTIVVVEWPEKVAGYLPKPDLTVNFSSEGAPEGERFIEMEQ